MKHLKLGIIGLSPGNGHPYSWSAICNGYNSDKMSDCPFPVIPEYLSKQSFPKDQLQTARVTHIWTQDTKISRHVAESCYIPNVCAELTDMIGEVDAVLLARDDAEHHFEMSKPFLEAGLPIYIDKPIAFTTKEAQEIFSLEQHPNQIFTATALAYAPELLLTSSLKKQVGVVRYISAVTSKDWKKYGVHIIEPVLRMFDHTQELLSTSVEHTDDLTVLSARWSDGLVTTWAAIGEAKSPMEIAVYGTKGKVVLTFSDTYRAFKNTIAECVDCVSGKSKPPPKSLVLRGVEQIEKGK